MKGLSSGSMLSGAAAQGVCSVQGGSRLLSLCLGSYTETVCESYSSD